MTWRQNHRHCIRLQIRGSGCADSISGLCQKYVNHNETGREVFGLIHFVEHTRDHAVYRVEQTIEQRTILRKDSRRFSSIVKRNGDV